jgi:hypothetical protein
LHYASSTARGENPWLIEQVRLKKKFAKSFWLAEPTGRLDTMGDSQNEMNKKLPSLLPLAKEPWGG